MQRRPPFFGFFAPIALVALSAAACACNKSAGRDGAGPTAAPTPTAGVANERPPSLPDPGPGVTATAARERIDAKIPLAAKLRPYLAGTPARAAFDAQDWAGCATQMSAWLIGNPEHAERRAAAILLRLCQEHGGSSQQAARGFEQLAESADLLAPHLWLRAAEAWLAAGDAPRAAHCLDKLDPSDHPRARRIAEIRGRVLLAVGQPRKAVGSLATAARGHAGADMLKGIASAAKLAEWPSEEARWLRWLIVQYPGSGQAVEAQVRLDELAAELRVFPLADRLTMVGNARRRFKRELAIDLAKKLRSETKPGTRMWCDAGLEQARAMETGWTERKAAAQLYDELVKACPKEPWMAPLAYRAAKRQMNSGDPKRALALFDLVAEYAPKTTLIDDAMRFQARILRELGKDAAADAKLTKIIALGGDMVEYAGWDLVWRHVLDRNYKACVKVGAPLLSTDAPAAKTYNEGRTSYWVAVCEIKAGRGKTGVKRLGEIASEQPLGWYGLMARRRLAALGKRAPTRTPQKTDRGDLLAANSHLLTDTHLLAGLELLRLGMLTSARAELRAVPWSHHRPDEALLKAALYAGIGEPGKATKIAMRAAKAFEAEPPHAANRSRWELAYPRPTAFREHVERNSKELSIDPMFVWSIMRSESVFNPRATSPVLATGLLQLMVPTANSMAARIGLDRKLQRQDLTDPALNIRLGTAYMRRLLDRTGNYAIVASSYNAGPGNTNKWLKRWPKASLDEFVERIPFRENRRYVKSVVTSWLRYRSLYGDGTDAELPWPGSARASDTGKAAPKH